LLKLDYHYPREKLSSLMRVYLNNFRSIAKLPARPPTIASESLWAGNDFVIAKSGGASALASPAVAFALAGIGALQKVTRVVGV